MSTQPLLLYDPLLFLLIYVNHIRLHNTLSYSLYSLYFFTLLILKFIYSYVHYYMFIYDYYYPALGALNIITRTSEWVITLWRSCELFLSRDMSRGHRMSEISLPKTIHMISTDDHHELVLVFIPYYYWLDIDFNVLCVQF